MSTVVICSSCGGKSRLKEKAGKAEYTAIQDQEAFQKIGQLKKALEKFKTKAEDLEKELKTLKSKLR